MGKGGGMKDYNRVWSTRWLTLPRAGTDNQQKDHLLKGVLQALSKYREISKCPTFKYVLYLLW